MLAIALSLALLCLAPSGSAGSSPDTSTLAPPRDASTQEKVLLEHGNVYLAWEEATEEFVLIVDGRLVTDVITGADSRGWMTFSGAFHSGQPSVYGAVDSVESGSWTVELTKSTLPPKIYHIQSTFAGIVIAMVQTCECSDGIGMSCTQTACKNKESCSAGTANCGYTIAAGQ